MSPAEHAGCYVGLLHALEDLLDTSVDLVEEEAIRNPYRQRVARDNTIIAVRETDPGTPPLTLVVKCQELLNGK